MNNYLWILPIILLTACQPTTCPAVIPTECPSMICPVNAVQDTRLSVYYINVGEGDSELIHYKDYDVLIDCGKNTAGPIIIDFLKSKKINQIDYLIVTHPDSDHLGGCDDILQSFNVTTVITNGQQATTESYKEFISQIDTEQILVTKENLYYDLSDARLTIIQANNQLADDNQNSIVSKLVYHNISFLFTGDCDNECEHLLLTKDISSTVLKVSHHGTKFGTSLAFIDRVNPKLAIIPTGENNYGHPAQETLDRLDQEGITTYRTDLQGTIKIATDGLSYETVTNQ